VAGHNGWATVPGRPQGYYKQELQPEPLQLLGLR
jgi:hypothetical protein